MLYGKCFITFTTSEFTSSCPVTGQPDFGEITIAYQPAERCLESKSLKLFLQSYRSHSGFWEALMAEIGAALVAALDPICLRVEGRMAPRGGIGMHATWDWARPE